MSTDVSFTISNDAEIESFVGRLRQLRADAWRVVGCLPPELEKKASEECEWLYTMFRTDIDHPTRADMLRSLRDSSTDLDYFSDFDGSANEDQQS